VLGLPWEYTAADERAHALFHSTSWSVRFLQVAVLGLPWEYTAADVRALIEAAAEADGALASEAGVEAVEVAYRDDGKSEVNCCWFFAYTVVFLFCLFCLQLRYSCFEVWQ
jgi:hypothetical protein